MKIYCDLDNTLCDFNERFKYFTDLEPNEYEQKEGKKAFWSVIDDLGIPFWSEMKWMKDGKLLWNYIKKYEPILLSAPSRHHTSRQGKRLWVENNLGNYKLILANRESKQNYSKENTILIDDNKDSIEEWNKKGGIGILHTSALNTIKELRTLGL